MNAPSHTTPLRRVASGIAPPVWAPAAEPPPVPSLPPQPPGLMQRVLNAREERARIARRLRDQFGTPVLVLTVNIPGPDKSTNTAARIFGEGQARLRELLELERIDLRFFSAEQDAAGFVGFYCAAAEAEALKMLAMGLEDGHALGRLFDVDVKGLEGNTLHRTNYGLPPRRCLLCGDEVSVCSRGLAHTLPQLTAKIEADAEAYFNQCLCESIGAAAQRALLYEVAVTPKPGLVDRAGTGAHADMDFFTFLNSASALGPYFTRCAARGHAYGGTPEGLLATLRHNGREAEAAMRRATGGVNTHKGLIFSLGILCAALGRLHGRNYPQTPEALFSVCASMCKAVPAELEAAGAKAHPSKGEEAYMHHQAKGARGEAAAGFPSVRNYAWPVFREAVAQGWSLNDAGVAALLHLLARMEDTNLLARGGSQALLEVRRRLGNRLARIVRREEYLELAAALDDEFCARNLSPGGCADMLALCYFLHFSFNSSSNRIPLEELSSPPPLGAEW